MTMQHQIHPDDERLAALAGGDPDVVADTELRAHVSACTQCRATVDELSLLRSALAELPDLVPSRRLQLLPPVTEPRAASAGWLRRLAGPVMAGGFAMVLVGAVGTSGVLNGIASSAGQQAPISEGAAEYDNASPLAAAGQTDTATRGSVSLDNGSPEGPSAAASSDDGHQLQGSDVETEQVNPPANAGERGVDLLSASDARLPWLVLIAFGVGVLLAGLYLRFSTQPRAG